MRAIDRTLVDEVWREITTYAPDRVEAEAGDFLARQPHVAAFCHAVTQGCDEAVQRAGLGLCFLLFKIVERSLGQPFPPVGEARIAEAYEATRQRLGLGAGAADPQAIAEGPRDAPHPSLVPYVLSVFYASEGDPASHDDAVRASFELLLTTLTDALDLGAVEG